jgi:5-methylcytosine-specific restriction endonuclease McrA
MAMRQTGKGNSQWKGGIGRFPYCYDWQNKEYKNYIKERDGGVCQLTGCNKSIDLVIHHVDYIKENCNVENLITLCRGCNTKVNVKRESYTKFFRSLLCKKFGYKYLTNLH